MKYYRANSWGFDIEEVEAERVTENSIWINGRRNALRGSYNYYSSWGEAKAYYIQREEDKIANLEQQMERAKEGLKKAQNI
jgi:hypothetical protein